MPKSRGRARAKRRSYVAPEPAPKRTRKESPRWYGPLVLSVMGVGVLIILANYMNLIGGQASQTWLYVGLGLIALGFLASTRWR